MPKRLYLLMTIVFLGRKISKITNKSLKVICIV